MKRKRITWDETKRKRDFSKKADVDDLVSKDALPNDFQQGKLTSIWVNLTIAKSKIVIKGFSFLLRELIDYFNNKSSEHYFFFSSICHFVCEI